MSKTFALRCESCAAPLTSEKHPLICRFCGAENWGKDSFSFSEQRAIANLRSLHSAELTFQATLGCGNYGTAEELFTCGLISPFLANAAGAPKIQSETGLFCEGENESLAGYNFQLTIFPRSISKQAYFTVLALASIKTYKQQVWNFYLDETGLIRVSQNTDALPNENSELFDVNLEQTLC